MKRNLIIVLSLLMAGAMQAQTSLDLVSRTRLRQQRLAIKQEINNKNNVIRLKGVTPEPATHVFGMVKMADGCSEETLRAEGVNVLRSRHGFAWVSVPVGDVERVASLKSVKRFQLARPVGVKNDKARATSGVDKMHSGTGLQQAYTGKGVMCGLVDNGIDPNHINFRSEDGKSRVGFLAQMTPDMYTGEVVEKFYSNNPAEVVNAKDITTFKTDDATTYHGSHTLGTMAGGYKGEAKVATVDAIHGVTIGTMDNPYYGMACNSDIAVGCGDLYDAIIAYGVDHILDYASYKQEPVVVNLSLGSNSGAHDGKGMINQYFDMVAKEDNAIICVSAGNEGDMKIALNKTLTADDKEVKSFILGQDMSAAGYGFVNYGKLEIYSADSSPLDIQAVIFNRKRGKVVQRYPLDVASTEPGTGRYWVSSADFQESDADAIDLQFANYFSGYIGIGWTYDEDTNRFNAILDYYAINNAAKNSDGNYVLGFIVTGKEGQRVDCFCDGLLSSISNFGIEGYDDGMYNGTISDMASGNSILVVGSYDTRSNWAALDGNYYRANYDITEGCISKFSSYGTLIDGRNLPHVCAPGASILSSMNTYYVENEQDRSSLVAQVDEADRKNYWGVSFGTSMSSPHVAGSIALWLEADPTLTIDDVKDIVAQTAVKDAEVLAADPVQAGAGKFNAYEGLKEVIRRAATGIGSLAADKPRMLVTAVGDKVFNVFMGGESVMDVSVYGVAGGRVLRSTVTGDETTVDMSSLPKGVYVLSVNGCASQKITIQ